MNAARRRGLGLATIWVGFPSLALVTACKDDGGAGPFVPAPTSIEITTTAPLVAQGQRATLSARVLDQSGSAMSGVSVSWSSDDPSTATIDPNTGLLEGVDGGEVRIVARAGSLSADVTAMIYYPVVADQARLRFRGTSESRWDWREGGAVFEDRLGTEVGDASSLYFGDGDLWSATAMFHFFLPGGRFQAGKVMLDAADPLVHDDGVLNAEAPVLGLLRLESQASAILHVSTGGWVDFQEVVLPPQPGERKGDLKGRLMARLTGFRLTDDGESMSVEPLGDEATLYGDFWGGLYHEAEGTMSLEVVGGPYPGVSAGEYAYAWYEGFSTWGEFTFGLLGADGEPVGRLHVHVPEVPQVGSWALSEWSDPWSSETPVGPMAVITYSNGWIFHSESGTLEIDAATPPPASDLVGEVRGSISASLVSPPDSPDPGGQVTVTGTFHVPWESYGYLGQSLATPGAARWLAGLRAAPAMPAMRRLR